MRIDSTVLEKGERHGQKVGLVEPFVRGSKWGEVISCLFFNEGGAGSKGKKIGIEEEKWESKKSGMKKQYRILLSPYFALHNFICSHKHVRCYLYFNR